MTESSASEERGAWRPWLIVGAGAATTFAGCGLLATWLLPRGHPAVWEWPLRGDVVPLLPHTVPAALLLAVVALLALDAIRDRRAPTRRTCLVIVLCLTLSSGLLMLCMMLDEADFPYRASAAALGDLSMGYYTQATRIGSVRAYVGDAETRTDPGHVPERVATHPPGPVLVFFWARNWLMGRPGVLAQLDHVLGRWSGDPNLEAMVLLGRRVATFGPERRDVVAAFWTALALTLTVPLVVPLAYGLGALAADRALGVAAATLAAAIPSLLCFSPSIEGPGIVLAAAVVLLWLWAQRTGDWRPAALCGGVWVLGLAWSFGLLALAVVLGVLGVGEWRREGGGARPVAVLAGLLFGAAIVQLAGALLADYDPLTSARLSLGTQKQLMALWRRPYGLSVLCNLYDFSLFAGPTLVLLAAAGTAYAGRGDRASWGIRALGIGVGVTLILLLVSGSTRGEVGRIWGFVMPLLTVPAAVPVLLLRGWSLMGAGLVAVVAQVALAVSLNSFLDLVSP